MSSHTKNRARSRSRCCRKPTAAAATPTSTRSKRACAKRPPPGAELVLLQELHNGPYFCQHESVDEFDRAEPIPGPSTARIGALADRARSSSSSRRCSSGALQASITTPRSCSIARATIAGIYRKMHIPDDPAFYEKFYFTPGDLGFEPIETSVGKLGLLVCWDQWYPEAARLMALAGADLLLYPTAIGWDPERRRGREGSPARCMDHRAARSRGRQRPAAARRATAPVSRRRPTADAASSSGARASSPVRRARFSRRPAPTSANCWSPRSILARSEHVRRIWPFLRDRRIDAYDDLLQAFPRLTADGLT